MARGAPILHRQTERRGGGVDTGRGGESALEKKLIDLITAEKGAHFEPYGWHHWPEHPWMSYQFRRALGETQ